MKPNIMNKHITYACDKCCTKVSYKGELCPRCHNGKGVQVDPVPRETTQDRNSINLCSGVVRLRKHSPTKN